MDILTHPFDLVLARDAQWPLVTRDGRKAEVLKWDCRGPSDLLAYLWDDYAARYDNQGRVFWHPHDFDLFLSADYSDPAVRVAVQKAHSELSMKCMILDNARGTWHDDKTYGFDWLHSQYRLAQHVPTPVEEKKLPEEWSKELNITVRDPDGWDRKNLETDWMIPLTRAEFERKACRSTCQHGHYVPSRFAKPQVVNWDCADDIPVPVCYLRWIKGPRPWLWTAILAVCDDGVLTVASSADGMQRKINFTGWRDLSEEHEYSTDRKEWKPCTKEVKRG